MKKHTLLLLLILVISTNVIAQNIPIVIAYFPKISSSGSLVFDRNMTYKEKWDNISKRYSLNSKNLKTHNHGTGIWITKKVVQVPLILNSNLFMQSSLSNDVVYVPVYYLIKTSQKASRLSTLFKEPLLTFIKNYNKIKNYYVLNRNAPIFVGYLKVNKYFGWDFAKQGPIKNYNTLEDFQGNSKYLKKKITLGNEQTSPSPKIIPVAPIPTTPITQPTTNNIVEPKNEVVVLEPKHKNKDLSTNKLAKVAIAKPINNIQAYKEAYNTSIALLNNTADNSTKTTIENNIKPTETKNQPPNDTTDLVGIDKLISNLDANSNEANIILDSFDKATGINPVNKDADKQQNDNENVDIESVDLNKLVVNPPSTHLLNKTNKSNQTRDNKKQDTKKNIQDKTTDFKPTSEKNIIFSFFKAEYDEEKISLNKVEKTKESAIKIFKLLFDESDNKFYVLSNLLPPGAIMKVRNTINSHFIYVKVISSIPASVSNNNQEIIVLSELGAKTIGVNDNSTVEITYMP